MLTPRFIPWDLPGRCTRCKSGTVEIDYIIQPQGVSIFSSRLKGGERFLAFDKQVDIPDRAVMRIKARNKVLNLPLKRPELDAVKEEGPRIPEYFIPLPEMKPEEQKNELEPGEIPL